MIRASLLMFMLLMAGCSEPAQERIDDFNQNENLGQTYNVTVRICLDLCDNPQASAEFDVSTPNTWDRAFGSFKTADDGTLRLSTNQSSIHIRAWGVGELGIGPLSTMEAKIVQLETSENFVDVIVYHRVLDFWTNTTLESNLEAQQIAIPTDLHSDPDVEEAIIARTGFAIFDANWTVTGNMKIVACISHGETIWADEQAEDIFGKEQSQISASFDVLEMTPPQPCLQVEGMGIAAGEIHVTGKFTINLRDWPEDWGAPVW